MPGDDFYIQSFFRLSTNRYEVLAPIPEWTIAQYAERQQLEPDIQTLFIEIIMELDGAVYIPWKQAKIKRETDKNKPKSTIRK